jgi:hypothetical protein
MEDKEQFSFWKQVQIRTKTRIKIPGIKLLLNLDQIYWEFKLVWKNLINSPKFLFALTFHIVNLY